MVVKDIKRFAKVVKHIVYRNEEFKKSFKKELKINNVIYI